VVIYRFNSYKYFSFVKISQRFTSRKILSRIDNVFFIIVILSKKSPEIVLRRKGVYVDKKNPTVGRIRVWSTRHSCRWS